MKARELLAKLAVEEKGNWNTIYERLQKKDYLSEETAIKGNYITIVDNEYPSTLKQVHRPPFVLFYEGNINLLQRKDLVAIGIDSVGKNGLYTLIDKEHHYIIGENQVSKLIAKTTQELTLVLKGDMNLKNQELIDLVLRNGGLVITETPLGCKTNENYTRIISGLENCLVVVHCEEKTPTTLMVMSSLYLNHKIYVMPELVNSHSKNNELINEGADIYLGKYQLEGTY